MKELLTTTVLLTLLASVTGCMPPDKHDVTMIIPPYTFEAIGVQMDIVYEVRCGALNKSVSTIDTFGHIALISSALPYEERLELEGYVIQYAEEICNS